MTEFEFAKFLGELPDGYIQQAQAFRNGSCRAMRTGRRKKRVFTFLAAAVLAVVMLGGFFWALDLQSRSETVAQSAADGWQDHVLRSEDKFRSETYRQTLTLEEYARRLQEAQADEQCAPWAYAKLDMDRDGTEELVVRFRSGEADILTLLLWREQDRIISLEYTKQQMSFLKEDGTFYYSSGNHWGWGRLKHQSGDWIPVIRMPQGEDYSSLKDVAWKTVSGAGLPEQTRASCQNLGLSGKNGVSGNIVGALTETEDCSLYVPITSWCYEQTSPYDTVQNADSWYCEEVPEARLTIFKTDSDSTAWQKPGYVFCGGTAYTLEMHKDTAEGAYTLQVYIRLGEESNYVMELEYPDGFWDRDILQRMLDSVRFTHSVSANREPEWTMDVDNTVPDAVLFVDLFVEENYSLYIPKEWDLAQASAPVIENMGQFYANGWYGPDGAGISVAELGKCSEKDAENWAIQSLHFDSFAVQEDGSISGNAGNTQIAVSFRQDGVGKTYAVVQRCPAGKAAESQPLLTALAESLMLSSG